MSAAVELEALAQCRGVLEGLRGTLAEGRQHRVSGVTHQAHATLRPVLERVPVVEPPLRRVLDQARECDDVVVTGVALERLAHVADHLLAVGGEPVALFALELVGVGLVVGEPHVEQLAAADPVRERLRRRGLAGVHRHRLDGVVVERAAVGLARRGDLVPRDQTAVDDDLGPALGRHARPDRLQHLGVDAVGTDQQVAGLRRAVGERHGHGLVVLAHGLQALGHVDLDRAVDARLRRELEDPLVEGHQQVEAVHVVEAGVVVGRRVVVERLPRDRAVLPDHPRLVEDRRPAAVDCPVGALGVTAVEVDAEPPAQPCAVRGDVQARSRGARRARLLEDVDRREDARLPQRQSGHQPRHATTCDKCPQEVPPVFRRRFRW